MGIKNLSQLINKSLYEDVPYETFSQKQIAIDSPYIMFRYNCVYGTNVPKAYVNLLTRLRTRNIHPIFIFDGEHPPEKLNERKKREATKATLISQIQRLEADLKDYEGGCASQPSELLQRTYKDKLMPQGSLVTIVNAERIREYITKLKQRTFTLKASDIALFKDILRLFMVPFDNAPGEAEIYCTKLCQEGHVSAVLSADTDIIAAGCPVILREITASGFKGIFLSNILEDLELTQDQLLDLCILCGTDFNENIPFIGPKKALNLIKTFQRLEDLPVDMDISILNFNRVRELYLAKHLNLRRSYPFTPHLDGVKVAEALRKYKLSYLYNSIKPLFK